MRVFNLSCEHGHSFEGWFRSTADFDEQIRAGLLACPSCDSLKIEKKLSAPAVLRGGVSRLKGFSQAEREQIQPQTPAATVGNAAPQITKEALMSVLSHPKFAELRAEFAKNVRDNTVDVGNKFAEEARAMHYEEKPYQSIRGQASREETLELLDEGIEVMPLPFKVDLPDYQ